MATSSKYRSAANRDLTPRQRARGEIVRKAERSRFSNGPPFRMKHLQRCVFICRQFKLVPESVLIAAGFNPR